MKFVLGFKIKYSRAPVSTDWVPAVYRGPKTIWESKK
jgi:hypothetical protein